MKLRNKIFTNLIYLFLLIIITFKCSTLAQSGSCSLQTSLHSRYAENICDRSNYLVHVSEGVNGCLSATGNPCWCILIDNNNREYDGEIRIEINQKIDRIKWNQFAPTKSYFKHIIVPGYNAVIIQPNAPPNAQNIITSIKIYNTEICQIRNTVSANRFIFQPPTIPVIQRNDFSHQKYNYVEDCMNHAQHTRILRRYCPNNSPRLMIEKRFTLNNDVYWCLDINNDDHSFSSADYLQIVYSSDNKYFGYFPSNAYIDGVIPGSNFHLGNRRTIIAISGFNNQLPDLISVTINHLSICRYSEPTVTARTEYHRIPEVSTPPSIDKSFNLMDNCGTKQIQAEPLIAFGSNTNPGNWPWHAAIYKLISKSISQTYFCGGTLINRKAVVTAAHCVVELSLLVTAERLRVEMGRHDLLHRSEATMDYRVFEVKTHEAYNPETYENDIAILILANYVQVTRYVNFICLPNPNENLQRFVGTAVGWGRDETNQLQTVLKVANLPVVDKINCLTSNREFFSKYLTQTNFCAGAMNNVTVCGGDSGGGFVYKSNSRWFLGGITSVGVLSKTEGLDCAINQYALFTDVTKFVTWINENS